MHFGAMWHKTRVFMLFKQISKKVTNLELFPLKLFVMWFLTIFKCYLIKLLYTFPMFCDIQLIHVLYNTFFTITLHL